MHNQHWTSPAWLSKVENDSKLSVRYLQVRAEALAQTRTYLQNLDGSAASSSISAGSYGLFQLSENGMPVLCSLVHPATLQEDCPGGNQLLLYQERMLAGGPVHTTTGWLGGTGWLVG